MAEISDHNLDNEENKRLTNGALANAYITLALSRMTSSESYCLYQVLETCLEADITPELSVRLASLLELVGIEEKEIENIWEVLETEEGKNSVMEFFNSSEMISGLIRDFREKAWVVVLNEKPSRWPSLLPMTYLSNVLTIDQVMTVLAYFQNPDQVELKDRLRGLVENLRTEFDEQTIIGTFKYVRDQLLHQPNKELF